LESPESPECPWCQGAFGPTCACEAINQMVSLYLRRSLELEFALNCLDKEWLEKRAYQAAFARP
jgi:hypothetical protein